MLSVLIARKIKNFDKKFQKLNITHGITEAEAPCFVHYKRCRPVVCIWDRQKFLFHPGPWSKRDTVWFGLKLPAHTGTGILGRVIAPPHLGVIVRPADFSGSGGSRWPPIPQNYDAEHRSGRESAARLAEPGIQSPAVVGVLMLVGGVDLWHHYH